MRMGESSVNPLLRTQVKVDAPIVLIHRAAAAKAGREITGSIVRLVGLREIRQKGLCRWVNSVRGNHVAGESRSACGIGCVAGRVPRGDATSQWIVNGEHRRGSA